MSFEPYREEIELELEWRLNEFRLLKNTISSCNNETKQDDLNKSLIVMLYSHYEGFFKNALLIYIKFINDLRLKAQDLNEKPELIASSLENVFVQYENLNLRNKNILRSSRAESSELEEGDVKSLDHIFRRSEFIKNYHNYMDQLIFIKDNVINTESNLKSHVLEKNLYKLSIKFDLMKDSYKDIDHLVNLRNAIAHGNKKNGIEKSKYDNIESNIIKKVLEKFIPQLSNEAKELLKLH